MSAAKKHKRFPFRLHTFLSGVTVLLLSLHTQAMVPLEEEELSSVTGEGLAFVFDDFSLRMAPTSFVELTGSEPTTQAAGKGWRRGDARYYGLSMTSGTGDGASWYSSTGISDCQGLECPLGKGTNDNYGVTAFASVYDPFVLRVYQYEGYEYDGTWSDADKTADPTVFEFIGPQSADPWRWAFWGELEIERDPNDPNDHYGLLQSQTLIYGRPLTVGKTWQGGNDYSQDGDPRPAILRLMETKAEGGKTLGVTYQSAISGDFRFSVAQVNGTSPDEKHEVPLFQRGEGMHFKNVDAYIPLGNLNYQAITFSGLSNFNANAELQSTPQQNGNFTMELTRIPDNPEVYNNFYCGATPDNPGCAQDSAGRIANPNRETEAYIRWGNWAGDPYDSNTQVGMGPNDLPAHNSTANGIYFQQAATSGAGSTGSDTVTNLGVSRIEGMRIHHMRITTLGAGS